MQPRPPRWFAPVRGSVLAVLVTLLTAGGHVAGGGTVADLPLLAVLGPLAGLALVGIAERCRTVLGVLATLGTGQLALHALLVALTAHTGHATGATPAMVAAHAAVTLAASAAVVGADGTVAALQAALSRVLPRRLRAAAVDVAPPARPVPGTDVPIVAGLVLLAAHARRGPPVGCRPALLT